ncbi:MAG: hypothetical protein OEM43_03840 [Gammaproteobacteria bacterium]|nr:hypothetical protein [Gammaproteobacteria bacterium]
MMLRSAFFVFIAGWVVWFWLDKPPDRGRFRLPEASDSLLENFQRAFDMLKAGHAELAFVYIWPAHYLILSLLGGVIIGMAWQSVARYFSFHRREYRARKRAIVETGRGTAEPEEKEKGHGN